MGNILRLSTIKLSSGRYVGYLDDIIRHGWGSMYYNNGEIYKGEWVDDKRTGTGIMNYNNGDKYEGKWFENKMHGTGKMTYKNGEIYQGKWVNDKRHDDKAEFLHTNGYVYVCKWIDDKMESSSGKIFYVKNNKACYEGEILNYKAHGKGKLNYYGEIYEGQFEDGQFVDGNMTYKNGDSYRGGWIFGNSVYEWLPILIKHGYGVLKWKDGRVCEGHYVNGKMTVGKLINIDGSIYEGNITSEDDRNEYSGKLTDIDVSIYEGSFISSNYFKKGKMIYNDSSVYDGEWKFKKWNGKGTYTDKEGNITIATYKDGKIVDGVVSQVMKNGDKFIGEFYNGKRHGPGKIIRDNIIIEDIWIDGELSVQSLTKNKLPGERVTNELL
jgi:hypothetical protein